MLLRNILPLLALAAFAPALSAAVITAQVSEYNGPFVDPSDITVSYPLTSVLIGTFHYFIPAGQIIGATVFGTFGNFDSENTTALSSYFVNGIAVSSCASTSDPCFLNDISLPPVSWSYTFTKAQLAALTGTSASFTVVQSGPFSVQTGITELDVTTAPEPGTLLLFAAAGLSLFAARKLS